MNEEKDEFTKDEIYALWSTGKPVNFMGTMYIVKKMNNGDYFMEPATWKGGENDGFSPDTQWLERGIRITVHGYKQVYYFIN